MDIEKLRLSRYFLIANSVILLIGLVIVFVGDHLNKNALDLGALLVNIGGNIIVIALIFFLGRLLLIDSQFELSERLKEIEKKVMPQFELSERLKEIEKKVIPQFELSERLKEIEKKVIPHSVPFFRTIEKINREENFINFVNRSQDLFMGGVALRSTAPKHRDILSEQIKEGARLRFLILDPNSPEVAAIAKRWDISCTQMEQYIENTLSEFAVLQKETIQFSRPGSIEVRLLSFEPAFSFAISNSSKPDGEFHGALKAYGLTSSNRPEWVLKAEDDWFNTLVESCENLWKDSRRWFWSMNKNIDQRNQNEESKPISLKAGVVAYRATLSGESEILLITARKHLNSWIFPAGSVEKGETLQKTASRECLEESGYNVKVGHMLEILEIDHESSTDRIVFFAAEVIGETKRLENDRQRKWIAKSKLVNSVPEVFIPIINCEMMKFI